MINIGNVKSTLSNKLSINIDNKRNENSISANSSSSNGTVSNISTLIKQKQEKEKELEKLKQKQKEHIADLQSSLSSVGNEIDKEIKRVGEFNSKNFTGWDSIYSSDGNNETSKSEQDANKNSTTHENNQKEGSEKSDIQNQVDEDQTSKTTNQNNKVSISNEDDLELNKKMAKLTDSLIKSGNLQYLSQDDNYNELTKLADSYKAEIETYKQTSTQEIEDLEKQIQELTQKIQKEKDNSKKDGQIINSYA